MHCVRAGAGAAGGIGGAAMNDSVLMSLDLVQSVLRHLLRYPCVDVDELPEEEARRWMEFSRACYALESGL